MVSAEEVIARLGLTPLPREGGWYHETYRSARELPSHVLGAGYTGARPAGTAIYYLLTPDTFSALHRLPGDEVFHFYLGDPVDMLQLDPHTGRGQVVTLGSDLFAGQCPQVVVRGGVWQGSVLRPGGAFALMGTTMAPGFDFADYESADRGALTAAFPHFDHWIVRLAAGAD